MDRFISLLALGVASVTGFFLFQAGERLDLAEQRLSALTSQLETARAQTDSLQAQLENELEQTARTILEAEVPGMVTRLQDAFAETPIPLLRAEQIEILDRDDRVRVSVGKFTRNTIESYGVTVKSPNGDDQIRMQSIPDGAVLEVGSKRSVKIQAAGDFFSNVRLVDADGKDRIRLSSNAQASESVLFSNDGTKRSQRYVWNETDEVRDYLYDDEGRPRVFHGQIADTGYRSEYLRPDGKLALRLGTYQEDSKVLSVLFGFDQAGQLRAVMSESRNGEYHIGLMRGNQTYAALMRLQADETPLFALSDAAGRARIGAAVKEDLAVFTLLQNGNEPAFAVQSLSTGYLQSYMKLSPASRTWDALSRISTVTGIAGLFKR